MIVKIFLVRLCEAVLRPLVCCTWGQMPSLPPLSYATAPPRGTESLDETLQPTDGEDERVHDVEHGEDDHAHQSG